jgi:hypothetical protein
MDPREVASAVLRRVAPRTVESLETLPGLVDQLRAELAELRRRTEETSQETAREVASTRADVAALRADLEDTRVRGGVADDALAGLHRRVEGLEAGVADLDAGLTESRRLSLQVGQMTDLVFDRLGPPSPGGAGD